LRFRVPQSLDSTWTSTREATEYPEYCYGYGEDEVGHIFSEDCLYLNVFRPSLTGNGKSTNSSIILNTTLPKKQYSTLGNTTLLPVAVWIHGGGLFMGGTVDQRYNMSFIIQNSVNLNKPMIVVSLQYRLSAWGFLGGAEALAGGATNLGYRDQRFIGYRRTSLLSVEILKELHFGERVQELRVLAPSSSRIMVSSPLLE
jgi:carboxylesterase type B